MALKDVMKLSIWGNRVTAHLYSKENVSIDIPLDDDYLELLAKIKTAPRRVVESINPENYDGKFYKDTPLGVSVEELYKRGYTIYQVLWHDDHYTAFISPWNSSVWCMDSGVDMRHLPITFKSFDGPITAHQSKMKR